MTRHFEPIPDNYSFSLGLRIEDARKTMLLHEAAVRKVRTCACEMAAGRGIVTGFRFRMMVGHYAKGRQKGWVEAPVIFEAQNGHYPVDVDPNDLEVTLFVRRIRKDGDWDLTRNGERFTLAEVLDALKTVDQTDIPQAPIPVDR